MPNVKVRARPGRMFGREMWSDCADVVMELGRALVHYHPIVSRSHFTGQSHLTVIGTATYARVVLVHSTTTREI